MTKLLAVFFSLLAPAFSAYRYYYSDPLTVIDPTRWAQSPEGLLLSRIPVPDGTSDYEISTRLTLLASGGVYTHYLRASADARPLPLAAGSYYAVEFQDPRISPTACIGTLAVYRQQNGVSTLLAMTEAPCRNGSVMRSVRSAERIEVYLDNVPILTVADSAIPAGLPGVGIRQTPAGNAIALVELGALDRTAPNAPDRAAIGVSAFPDYVDTQWPAATDDPAGTGILRYEVFRDGRLIARTPNRFTDAAVSGGATYEYSIVAVDYHGNRSQPASVTVTTPASAARRPKQADEPKSAAANAVGPGGSLDPRRVGVRPLGVYWGSNGEQIDVRSGNLNFTIPLMKAMARNGWSVTFSLNYNSQLWRQDPGGTWKLGQNVGYGFGWRLLAGSVFPYWSDPYTLDHYVFTDNTGAEYRLDLNTNGVWTSIEGVYVAYDQNQNRLYFPDGSFWVMGSASAGTEEDTGTLYPTTMQDSNGNQILIRYNPGMSMSGWNSSARIEHITDFRALGLTPDNTGAYTYLFAYNNNYGPIPTLWRIYTSISTGERYEFSYQNQALNSPWGEARGTTTVLASVSTIDQITPFIHQFAYDASGSGELSQVTLPYGAHLRWVYANITYSGSRVLRAVNYRYFSPAARAPETQHWLGIAADASYAMPPWSCLNPPDNIGQRCWFFVTDTASPYLGLASSYEERPAPSTTALRSNSYTWTLDAAGTPYTTAVVTTLEPGTANAIQTKTEQTLDTHGNVIQTRLYNFGNLSTPARVYDNTYLGGANYTSRYIFNRLLTSSVTASGQTVTLVNNAYDAVYYPCSNAGLSFIKPGSNLSLHDSANYGETFTYRGNLALTQGATVKYTCTLRDITGTVRISQDGAGHVLNNDTSTSTANFAAPGVVTPYTNAGLSTQYTYSNFMGITSATEPNSATTSISYDGYARPASVTSPHGATTAYTYTNSPPTRTATTGSRWEKTTYDGIGRAVKVERGDGAPSSMVTRSIVDTEYTACACSPTGKVKRVSQPYAPGTLPENRKWTTYNYDSLGRTQSVVAPDDASTTAYSYTATRTTVTDPAGKWKTFTTDAFGNLVQVTEPNPAGGNVETYYTYDSLNNLTQVSMPRGGYTQTRTFAYNGRLLTSATNPENGTVTYTYNNDWTVATRTDAKGQKLVYEYDAYARLVRTHNYRTDTIEDDSWIDYYYDSNPFDPSMSDGTWGRLAATVSHSPVYPSSAYPCVDCFPTTDIQMFSYTSGGLVKTKRLRVEGGDYYRNVVDLDVKYTYDNEGRVLTVSYPNTVVTETYNPDPLYYTYTYSYDGMGRPNKLTETPSTTWYPTDILSGVQYGPAGEMTQMGSETRQYNSLLQLTRITVPGSMDIEYRYSPTQNDGRITQQKDWIGGEEVTYTYDSLNRLVAAVTTGPEWGMGFTYDGFGNLTQKTVTKGSAPTFSAAVDPATNRYIGYPYSYDANGNLGVADSYNRLLVAAGASGTMERYTYTPDGKRVTRRAEGVFEYYIYGADGKKLATYNVGRDPAAGDTWYLQASVASTNLYFAGKLIKSQGVWVTTDRLGSVRANGRGERFNYYPYGEERTSTTNYREKFGTYFRDTGGLDYADQRYYSSAQGRFLTPDPYQASSGPANPPSWNRYSYVHNDPINGVDPTGLERMELFVESVDYTIEVPIGDGVWVKIPIATATIQRGRAGRQPRMQLWEQYEATGLSETCARALVVAGKTPTSIELANGSRDQLERSATAAGIDWRMLAAIGVRETGFLNIAELQKGGKGRGVFQIDIGKNPSVIEAQAFDFAFAADWAANLLANNMATLGSKFPNFNATQLLQATAASYNFGTRNISGNPATIDRGSTRDNYGSNVLNLMDCFN